MSLSDVMITQSWVRGIVWIRIHGIRQIQKGDETFINCSHGILLKYLMEQSNTSRICHYSWHDVWEDIDELRLKTKLLKSVKIPLIE